MHEGDGDTDGHEAGPLGPLAEAMERISIAVRDGLEHGFFEYGVSCELLPRGKRQLTIKVGKSYRFVIPKEAIGN